MQYELHFNLQQKAALIGAISCWENQKNRINEFFTSCGIIESDEAKNKWIRLTQQVVEESNQKILPSKLKGEFIYIVKEIGKKIFNWFKYILYENNLKHEETLNYINKIYWTPYGTVDEVETFRLSWLENSNLSITKVYNNACKYALKKEIDHLWQNISKLRQINFINENEGYDQQLSAYWKYIRDGDVSFLKKCFDKSPLYLILENFYDISYYDDNCSPEENMLKLSVQQGNRIATKYFWEKLTEDEKNRSVINYARIAVIYYIHSEHEKDVFNYKNENYVEICIFLINQMTKDQKKLFLNEASGSLILDKLVYKQTAVKSIVLRMLLLVWPWQELLTSVLNEMFENLQLDSRIVQMCLDVIINKMVEHHMLGHSVRNSRYQRIFHEVWLIIPGSMKQKIIQDHPKCDFICRLLDIWDLSSIKLIINDPEIAAVRDQYLESGHKRYRWLIINDQYERLDQFIEEVLRSEKEKKYFKKKIIIRDYQILDDKFHLVDTVLHWQWNKPENMHYVKSVIDHINLCELFIKTHRCDLADKFLNWTCETEEEKRKYKDHLRDNMFLTSRLMKYGK
ncbi:uncharacterized protein [Chelonus insularis]|uniref:uncharacterized protein n=1 Tax=Chelonus insularis TaxID=460826 RepID=UPI001589124C|nr:uncharacterized protein LOC118071362 [Chelonus insularis]